MNCGICCNALDNSNTTSCSLNSTADALEKTRKTVEAGLKLLEDLEALSVESRQLHLRCNVVKTGASSVAVGGAVTILIPAAGLIGLGVGLGALAVGTATNFGVTIAEVLQHKKFQENLDSKCQQQKEQTEVMVKAIELLMKEMDIPAVDETTHENAFNGLAELAAQLPTLAIGVLRMTTVARLGVETAIVAVGTGLGFVSLMLTVLAVPVDIALLIYSWKKKAPHLEQIEQAHNAQKDQIEHLGKIISALVTLQRMSEQMHKYKFRRSNFNIAFIGKSGVGKSSLIKALRHAEDNNEKAPPPCCYEYSDSRDLSLPTKTIQGKKAILWDMPAGGTAEHPWETYAVDFFLMSFDLLVVVFTDALSDEELQLYVGLSEMFRKFKSLQSGPPSRSNVLYVRNKIDQVSDERQFGDIRTSARLALEKAKATPDATIYLVNSRMMGTDSNCFDFDKLVEFLNKDCKIKD